MRRQQSASAKWSYIALVFAGVLYFIFVRSPLRPRSWRAPPNPGYTGPYRRNRGLRNVAFLPLAGHHGPEDMALDETGRIYLSTNNGCIVRLQPDGSQPQDWANTGGRPLGLCFDHQGNLIVADAYKGLLSIAPDGTITALANQADGVAIGHANGVTVSDDGQIYLTDASTRFAPGPWGTPHHATTLAVIEHGGDGRLLVYDANTDRMSTLLRGLDFANGVTLSHDRRSVLVVETASYRVIRYWTIGEKKGQVDVVIDALPGFPDNISSGCDGRYWIGLVSERSGLLDRLAPHPFVRKAVAAGALIWGAQGARTTHVVAIDDEGQVLCDLQAHDGKYPSCTGARETATYLYLTSAAAGALARLKNRRWQG